MKRNIGESLLGSNAARVCVLSYSAALALFATAAFAEPPAPTPTPLPKTGSLASSVTAGSSGGAAGAWGSDVLEKSPAPIGGSVSKKGNSWVARVFNNSQDSYSANFKVIQVNDRGTTTRNDYFSVSLQPGKSSERTFSAANGAVSASLELNGWTKVGGSAEGEKAAAEGTAAPEGARAK